jgi:hypothetical protein
MRLGLEPVGVGVFAALMPEECVDLIFFNEEWCIRITFS